MKIRVLALLAGLLLPLPLLAETTYTYTGNPYTEVFDAYTTSDYLSITFNLSAPLADNLAGVFITPDSWFITDGIYSDSSADADSLVEFGVMTDGSGTIYDWLVQDEFFSYGGEFISVNDIGTSESVVYDRSVITLTGGTAGGENVNDPGTWTETGETTVTPEPESLVLVGSGLVALAATARRRFLRS